MVTSQLIRAFPPRTTSEQPIPTEHVEDPVAYVLGEKSVDERIECGRRIVDNVGQPRHFSWVAHAHIVHSNHDDVNAPTDQTYAEQQPDAFGCFDVAEEGGGYGVEGGRFGNSHECGLSTYWYSGHLL